MIWIPGNVPSSKTSQIKTQRGIFKSRAVSKYLQFIGVKRYSSRSGVENYKRRPNIFDTPELREEFFGLCYPVTLGVHFVRKTKGRFDFINACQIIFDLLVAHRILEDDDMDHLLPVPLRINRRDYTVSKHRPGVFLQVLSGFELPHWEVIL